MASEKLQRTDSGLAQQASWATVKNVSQIGSIQQQPSNFHAQVIAMRQVRVQITGTRRGRLQSLKTKIGALSRTLLVCDIKCMRDGSTKDCLDQTPRLNQTCPSEKCVGLGTDTKCPHRYMGALDP